MKSFTIKPFSWNPTTITAALGLFCVLTIGLGALGYKVYVQRSDEQVVRTLGSWMPAARVGSRVISYGRFTASRATMRTYLSSQLAKGQGVDSTMTVTLEKASLDRLMREAAVEEMARERHVEVPDKDVRDSFDTMVASTSSTVPDPTKYLQETFGWTADEYRANIVRPAIMEERVGATMTSDTQQQYIEVQKAVNERLEKPDAKMYLQF